MKRILKTIGLFVTGLIKGVLIYFIKALGFVIVPFIRFYKWDKAQHYFIGIGFTALIRLAFGLMGWGFVWTLAFPLMILVAFLKELYDYYQGSGFNAMDMVATLLGSLTYLFSLTVN